MSSITKKGEIESASRPLMGFGELNDNMIKGLTIYLSYHEQGFIRISIGVLTDVSRNQIKREFIVESQACCDKKWETNIHAMLIYGFYSWLDIFEAYLRYKKLLKVLVQGFMKLNKKKRHTLMCYILVLYLKACNDWNMIIIHDYKARQAHYEER